MITNNETKKLDINMLQLSNLVGTGLSFVRAITERYGVDKGNEIWQSIIESLDEEARGAIMFAMLTGKDTCDITINYVPVEERVNVIKIVRSATGWGLKEAKDQVDIVTGHNTATYKNTGTGATLQLGPGSSINIPVQRSENRHRIVQDLQQCGCHAY